MWIFCIQKGEKLSNFKGSKSWRLILLFSVFALVVVACGGDTAEEEVVEEATKEELSAEKVEPIKHNPEAEQNNKVNFKISGNRTITTMDRVYGKIFNNN
mgnify:CR=1 FL=1